MSDKSAVSIRDARAGDRDAIRELTLTAYGEYARVMAPDAWAGLDQAVRGALASDDGETTRIVAEIDGRLVGSVLLYPPASDAYGGAVPQMTWPEVRLLAVSPEARGRGVARRLMAECVRRARAGGASGLGLHTSQSMTTAMQMYARMGFVRAPEYDFQPPGAELVQAFCLHLNSAESV